MADNRPTLSDLTPEQEAARIEKIRALSLVPGDTNLYLEELVTRAKLTAKSKFAAITILDEKTQWLKAESGMGVDRTPRELAFCNHTILRPEGVAFVVEDTLNHIAFKEHPMVLNAPKIRSYLGLPLVTSDGHALGAICVFDVKARIFTAAQIEDLAELSKLVVQSFERR